MISGNGNNQINTFINRQSGFGSPERKTSVNKYYNIFSKKLEEIEIPNIDLEFNAVMIPEKSTFMRSA